MITLRKQRQKINRNSLLVTSTSKDALVQIALSRGCFSGKDIGSLGCKDSLGIYNFLCSLLAYALRALSAHASHAASIVVLIDGTQVPVKVLRVVLRACQNALAYKIKQAVVVEPERFLDQQKISLDLLLEAYDFKTTVCPKAKLWKYVNVADLAEHFGAILTGGWTDIRSSFEQHFKANPIYFSADNCLSLVDNLTRLIKKDQSIFVELSNKALYAPLFRERAMSIAALPRERKNTIPSKSSLPEHSRTLPPPTTSGVDSRAADAEVGEVVASDDHRRNEALEKLASEHLQLSQEVVEWLKGTGTAWTNAFDEVGESTDECRQLEKEHRQLMERAEELEQQAHELQESAAFMSQKAETDFAQHKSLAEEAVSLATLFKERVVKQQSIHAQSTKFHELIGEFYTESDTLLKSLCSETKSFDGNAFHGEIGDLDRRVQTVDDKFEQLMGVYTRFCSLLKEAHADENTSNGDHEQPKSLAYVSGQLSSATDRRKRCYGLVDLRKLKLQQMIQLVTCEKDAQQALEWLQELTSSIAVGTSPQKVLRFSNAAKQLYDYGKQLSQVSLLLRRSLRLEMFPQKELDEKVEAIWQKFDKALETVKRQTSTSGSKKRYFQ